MGRGRQKAKHQKVARELKYHTSDIDVTALKRELATGDEFDRVFSSDHRNSTTTSTPVDDPYGGYSDSDDDDED
ncbi:MAG: DUF3073 domain-containing protein [Nakamurella sp.]